MDITILIIISIFTSIFIFIPWTSIVLCPLQYFKKTSFCSSFTCACIRFLLLFLVIYLIYISRHQRLTCYPTHQSLPPITIGCFEACTTIHRTTRHPFVVVNQTPLPDVSEAACTGGIQFSLAVTTIHHDPHAFIEVNRTTVFNSPAKYVQ